MAGGARGAEYTLFKETLAEVRLYARNKSAYERAGLRDLMLSRADLRDGLASAAPAANAVSLDLVRVGQPRG